MNQRDFLLGLADYFENIGRQLQLEAQPAATESEPCFQLNPLTLTASLAHRVSEPLTAKEFQIATFLNSVVDRIVTRDEILRNVWGCVRVNTKTITVHIFNLRRKLAPLGVKIVFIEPDAYRLVCGREECAYGVDA